MKDKRRTIWGLVIVVALLGTLLGFLLYQPLTATTEEAAALVYEVVNLPLSALTAVKVENETTAYAVLNGTEGVEMVSKYNHAYDEAQLRAFLYAASHISGSRKVTDQATFKGYGTEQPRATVTLYRSDDSQLQYQVLADNPLDQNTYFYAVDEQAVYLIAREIAALFLRTEQDFVSRTVFPLRTQEDFDAIDRISITYHGAGRDYTVEQTDQGFYLTAPVQLRLSRTLVYTELLNPLLQLYADDVVATQADIAQYGFDAPEMEIALTMNGQTKRALLLRTENNQCLLAEVGGTVVYRLEDVPMLMLMQDYTVLLSGGITTYTSEDLADLSLTSGERSLFITFTGSGAGVSAQMDGTPLPQTLQNQLIKTLSQLTPTAEITASIAEEPTFAWTATLRKGTQEKVSIIPATADLYVVSINGTAHFATDAAAVQRVQALWDALISLK